MPVEIVSDNGPPFNSVEFTNFCLANGIKPVKSPPYHPQSNGIAERGVQTVKKALEKSLFLERGSEISKKMLINRLLNFLFIYRNTPSTVTGISPAQCLFKFRPRTRFDLIKPSCEARSFSEDNNVFHKRNKLYHLNESVYFKDKQSKIWLKGKIIKVISHSTYLVLVGESVRFVHGSDLRSNPYCDIPDVQPSPMVCEDTDSTNTSSSLEAKSVNPDMSSNFSGSNVESYVKPEVSEVPVNTNFGSTPEQVNSPSIGTETSKASRTTRSGRIIKTPTRLNL